MFGFRTRKNESAPSDLVADELVFDRGFERRLEALAMRTQRPLRGGMRAERASRNLGVGVEFAEHSAYSAGEDVRFVDWSVYERSSRLVVRKYTELADLCVHLLLDTSASMAAGPHSKFEFARRIVAALAYISLARLDRVGVISVSDDEIRRFRPVRGRHRMLRVVSHLRSLRAEGTTNLALGAAAIAASAGRRGIAVIVSDLYDPRGIEPALDRLRYAGVEVHVVHLLDPDELNSLEFEALRLVDAERDLRVDVELTPALLEEVRAKAASRADAIARICVDRGIGHHRVDVRASVEEAVLRVLRRGGLVG